MPKTIQNKVETRFTADDRMTRQLSRMNRAMNRMNRIARRVKRSLMAAGRAALLLGRGAARIAKAGIIGIAGAATALFYSVTKLAGGMDELAKTTRAIDFDIEKFQEFKFVAEQTGVSGDKFGTILKKFSATVGEFRGGYGTMFTALKRLNPQLAKQLKTTKSTSDAFEIYLGAIRDTENPLKKSALASAAFGKRMGIDMINMANLSADELANLRKQMRENGVVTAEQAKKAEAYNDMMNRTKLTLKSVAIDGLTPLMPLFTEGMDGIRKWVNANRELIRQKVEVVFKNILKYGKVAFNFLRENVPPLIDKLKKLGKDGFAWVRENKQEIRDFGRVLGIIADSIVRLAGFVIRNKEAVLAAVVAYKALGLSMTALNFAGASAGFGSVGGAVGGLTGKVKGLSGMLGKGGLLFTAFAAGWGVGSMIFNEWNKSMDSLLVRTSNVASKIGLTAHKMGNVELKSELNKLKKEKENKLGTGTFLKSLVTGNIQEYRDAVAANNQAQADINNELTKRLNDYNRDMKKFLKGEGPRPEAFEQRQARKPVASVEENLPPGFMANLAVDPSKSPQPTVAPRKTQPSAMLPGDTSSLAVNPQVQTSKTETVKTERHEVIIKTDRDTKAEITRGGNNSGLTLETNGGY